MIRNPVVVGQKSQRFRSAIRILDFGPPWSGTLSPPAAIPPPVCFCLPPPRIALFYDYCPSTACKSSPSDNKKKREEAHNQTNCRLGKLKLIWAWNFLRKSYCFALQFLHLQKMTKIRMKFIKIIWDHALLFYIFVEILFAALRKCSNPRNKIAIKIG